MRIRDYLKTFLEDFKASRRGEKRIAPRNVRGRVYAKKAGDETAAAEGGMQIVVKKEPVATLTMKVTRADGSVETITVPAQVTHVNG